MIKKAVCFLLILVCVFFVQESQAKYLRGKIERIGENNKRIPEVNLNVEIEETGDQDNTNSKGKFRIFLKDIFY